MNELKDVWIDFFNNKLQYEKYLNSLLKFINQEKSDKLAF